MLDNYSTCILIIRDVFNKNISFKYKINCIKKKIKNNYDFLFIKNICFSIIENIDVLKKIYNIMVSKCLIKNRIKNKSIIYYILILGIYNIYYTNIPDYYIAYNLVESTKNLNINIYKFINYIIRLFLINKNKYLNIFKENKYKIKNSNNFIIEKIKSYYPNNNILNIKNKDFVWLRINRLLINKSKYINILNNNNVKFIENKNIDYSILINIKENYKIILSGLNKGLISIQDISSQECIISLNPKNNEYILDMCSSPGLKASHIIELAPFSNLTLIDINNKRINLINDNFNRLKINKISKNFKILNENSINLNKSYNNYFDKIILDAPCSSTGIIHKNPDIIFNKSESKFNELIKIQKDLLNSAWIYLKKGGIMIYSTCSILLEENIYQITNFLKENKNAISLLNDNNKPGKQIIQKENFCDGFYYAKIYKN
ncbi:ribosomal RNA small subunit methyltransferase B [endosymbiont of Sipalinus gigas]|uniref:RsmB/NOP family class I SAM-dependent RNA methyltransferase n=1 Tax=endosymbiont of Sipalinus gigas TaxID=1972134 RepID=UPI000DC6F50D|nr:RsmB/NOP family class I SAM-dependent RNA methyltransferase [endosymbiont of Sipalinus gigas]BBA85239.1 ribosomal RNA small subunit methyltransferase B [endosymbiont of Sipalinus gigas]